MAKNFKTEKAPKKLGGQTIVILDRNDSQELCGMVDSLKTRTQRLSAYPTDHCGRKFSLAFGFAGYNDSVTAALLDGLLSQAEIDRVVVDPGDGFGARACLGLPTTQVVADIAATPMDEAILGLVGEHAVYTRYNDALVFSFDETETGRMLKRQIPNVVAQCGFSARKPQLYDRYGW